MRILHYSLGFPPYRSGGLTKFCIDLMVEQSRQGHQTGLLWPGRMNLVAHRTTVKARGSVVLCVGVPAVQSFEVINPLPVPYDEGICRVSAYMANAPDGAYDKVLELFRPDVIHIHTLMGLHRELLEQARRWGIRLVFSAHDFYPICPKVTLFRNGAACSDMGECAACPTCNVAALSLGKITALQSPLYRALKESPLVKRARKRHRDRSLGEAVPVRTERMLPAEDFRRLRQFYAAMLCQMDVIHFNSRQTMVQYEKRFALGGVSRAVIPISHSVRPIVPGVLRIRYLGPQSSAKGYFLLKKALDRLWTRRQDFCLDLHFEPLEREPYMRVHGRYQYAQLGSIFTESDVLVVPSIWYETFGYTALEALSFGVPVILSDTVGAQDILAPGAGVVIEAITEEKLCRVLDGLSAQRLAEMNHAIMEYQYIPTMPETARKIERICYCGQKGNEEQKDG